MLAVFIGGNCIVASAAEEAQHVAKVDTAPLGKVPVFHHGRVMPLDTLAKVALETISGGGTSVKLGLDGYYTPEELKSSALAPALEIFPAGKTRRLSSVEVLLSWLIEADKWEDVPFILCEHGDLHQALGLKSKTDVGMHRKYVTPRMIAQSQEVLDYLADHRDRLAAAQTADKKFKPTPTDERMQELLNRYRAFRKLSHDPRLNLRQSEVMVPGSRDEFLVQFMAARDLITSPNDKGRKMLDMLQQFIELQEQHGLDSQLADAARMEIGALAEIERLSARLFPKAAPMSSVGEATESGEEPRELTLAEAEAAVVLLRRASIHLEEVLKEQTEKLFGDAGGDGQQAESLRPLFRELEHKSTDLKRIARQMHLALYDNGAQFNDGDEFRYGASVYVTPSLNPAALARERDTANEAEPWLSLQTVLYGSNDLLYGEAWPLENYNRRDIQAVRAAWASLADAYTNRAATDRPEAVIEAEEKFSAALRRLGEELERKRTELVKAELPRAERDESLIAYTSYPAADRVAAEVTYNHVKPFQWSWVICLFSVAAFGLSFGVMKKQAFWVGVAILALGIVWTSYGFYLRVAVTQWAPVTNMYETVVFVPFVVALMALWFLVLPLLWTGITDAWRLTAIPGSWEAEPLDKRRSAMMSAGAWNIPGFVLAPARLALMAWAFYQLTITPYSDGHRPIFRILQLPHTGTVTEWVGWVIGWGCVLAICWFGPRVILTAILSLVFIPWSWAKDGGWNRMIAGVYPRWTFGICGAAAATFFFMIAANTTVLDEDFRPLQPVLRSNFWLTIHVLTIVASYAAGMLAWAIGLVGLTHYLFGRYRDPVVATNLPKGLKPAGGDVTPERLGKLPPEACATLAQYAYRAVQVAVLLLAAGTILGGLWADVSWGRFWGWDPKEVWALISLLVYLAILHGRYAGWFNNFGMIVGTVLGAIAIAFSWYGVNFILPLVAPDGTAGLHSYGTGAGGVEYVTGFIVLNILYLVAAWIRYAMMTGSAVAPIEVTPEIVKNEKIFDAEVVAREPRPHGA
jgi:ABC-type transport system involved in cytochrome c biogenesis permease subunit